MAAEFRADSQYKAKNLYAYFQGDTSVLGERLRVGCFDLYVGQKKIASLNLPEKISATEMSKLSWTRYLSREECAAAEIPFLHNSSIEVSPLALTPREIQSFVIEVGFFNTSVMGSLSERTSQAANAIRVSIERPETLNSDEYHLLITAKDLSFRAFLTSKDNTPFNLQEAQAEVCEAVKTALIGLIANKIEEFAKRFQEMEADEFSMNPNLNVVAEVQNSIRNAVRQLNEEQVKGLAEEIRNAEKLSENATPEEIVVSSSQVCKKYIEAITAPRIKNIMQRVLRSYFSDDILLRLREAHQKVQGWIEEISEDFKRIVMENIRNQALATGSEEERSESKSPSEETEAPGQEVAESSWECSII